MYALVLLLISLSWARRSSGAEDTDAVARVGEVLIYAEDLHIKEQPDPDLAGAPYPSDARTALLDGHIDNLLLLQQARALGLDLDPTVRKVIISQYLRAELFEASPDQEPSEQELRDYYAGHSEDFATPEKRKIRHILVSDPALAEQLHRTITDDPDQMAQLATQHSESAYRRRGGDIGFVAETGNPRIDPAIVTQAFTMAEGDISPIFQTEDGYNIIRVMHLQPGANPTFEEARDAVARRVQNLGLKDAYAEHVAMLWQQASVVVAPRFSAIPNTTTEPLDGSVARVNDTLLSEEDFRAVQERRVSTGQATEEEIAIQLLEEELVYQQALRSGYQDTPKVNAVLINLLLREEVYQNVQNSDFSQEALRAYYDAHREDFTVPEKRRIFEITIYSADRGTEAARVRASEAHARLTEGAEDFSVVAAEYSESPSQHEGGDLGFMSATPARARPFSERRGWLDRTPAASPPPPALIARAFETEVGALTAPFASEEGYHIIYVDDLRAPVVRSFEQARSAVLRAAKDEHLQTLYTAYVDALRAQEDIWVDPDRLLEVPLHYPE